MGRNIDIVEFLHYLILKRYFIYYQQISLGKNRFILSCIVDIRLARSLRLFNRKDINYG